MIALTTNQLRTIRGGETPEEYCQRLYNWITGGYQWPPQQWANLLGGWDYYNCSEYFGNIEGEGNGD